MIPLLTNGPQRTSVSRVLIWRLRLPGRRPFSQAGCTLLWKASMRSIHAKVARSASGTDYSTVDMYDALSGQWSASPTIGAMSVARAYFASAAVGARVFFAGGEHVPRCRLLLTNTELSTQHSSRKIGDCRYVRYSVRKLEQPPAAQFCPFGPRRRGRAAAGVFRRRRVRSSLPAVRTSS